jgi:hypothetical protein
MAIWRFREATHRTQWRVRIATPPEVDSDCNDVLLARAKEIRHAG